MNGSSSSEMTMEMQMQMQQQQEMMMMQQQQQQANMEASSLQRAMMQGQNAGDTGSLKRSKLSFVDRF